MKAILLAAGRGERMRPLTDDRPKPLLEVAGKPLIQYHLESLAGAGVVDVVINLSWQGRQIADALGDGKRWGLSISYSEEGSPPLETGGGIFRALPQLGESPFLVIAADVWTDLNLSTLMDEEMGGDLARLVLVRNPDHKPQGDFLYDNGRLLKDGGQALTFSGIGVYRPELFDGCQPGAFPIAPLLYDAVNRDRVAGIFFKGQWTDVGTPERLAELEARLAKPAPELP